MNKTRRIKQMIICMALFTSLFLPTFAVAADHLVDNSENIPCVLWCRGCTPTSASMVLGYWDRGNAGWEWYGYGKLIDYWQELRKHYDGTGPIINVPNVLEELRIAMGTSVNGSTSGSNIGTGVTTVCNTNNGYNFSSSGTECDDGNNWCWEAIKNEINNNHPCLWGAGYHTATSSVGHSLAAWGYTDAKYIITYNTWQCPGRDDWYYKKYHNGVDLDFARLDTVVPGGGNWGQTSLTSPDGGEVWTAGKTYNITWHEFDERTWSADLYYSTDAGASWIFINRVEPSSPDWKNYLWTVPTVSTTQARVKIKNHSGSVEDGWTYQAGDGSEDNFTIQEDHTPPTPDPMFFAIYPHEINTSEIGMTATAAFDSFGPIEYYFDFFSSFTGGTGGTDSGWQASQNYIDTGLDVNHRYAYRVKTRDGSPAHNETDYSILSYEYTDIQTPTDITYGTVTSNSIACKSTNTPWGLTRGASGLWLECYLHNNSGWQRNNNSWTQSGLSVNTKYWFRAKARNGDAGETPFCSWSSRYTLANLPAAPTITNPTLTTLDVTINKNGNPAPTEYAVYGYDYGDSSGFFLDPSGAQNDSISWHTISDWGGTVRATGLTHGTHYCFWVRARNGNKINTSWSASGCADTIQPIITVMAPNGGENWHPGDVKTISWKSNYIFGNVKIEISRNSGAKWLIITKSTANDGSYSWHVTTPTANFCYLRITSVNNSEISDISDAYFSITPHTPPCPADFNGDGNVDDVDLAIISANFGDNGCAECDGDLDGDGDIDGDDLAQFLAAYVLHDCP